MEILITIYVLAAFFLTAKAVFDYNITKEVYGKPDSTDIALSLGLGITVGLVGWFLVPFFVLWKLIFKTTLTKYVDKLIKTKGK